MTDDKPVLTRRRMLGGMATVGAAGALGAGTWAQFKDTESASVEVTAGTLNLTVNGGNPEGVQFDIEKVAPGDAGSRTITLRNEGNLTGELKASFSNVTNKENGRNDPEEEVDSDTTGELGEHLKITISGDYGSEGPHPLNWYAGNSYTLEEMEGGESGEIIIEWEVPGDVGNSIQSDSVSFDISATLTQA